MGRRRRNGCRGRRRLEKRVARANGPAPSTRARKRIVAPPPPAEGRDHRFSISSLVYVVIDRRGRVPVVGDSVLRLFFSNRTDAQMMLLSRPTVFHTVTLR